MLLGLKKQQEFLLEIGSKIINVTRSGKLLGITVNDELKFVEALCQKVCRKSMHSRGLLLIWTGRKGKSCTIHS